MTYGPDAVVELVRDAGWSYPVSARRLEREFPLKNVQIDARGNSITLTELLSRIDAKRFESEEDLRAALGPVMVEESANRRRGVVGWFKKTFLGG